MRFFLISLSLILTLSGPVRADEAAFQQVISSQISAMQADDFETAFEYASPKIKQIFGSYEQFGVMVRQGYPMVWRPAEVTYLNADQVDGHWVQPVQILDQAGALHILDYLMTNGPDGWKIDGVFLREPVGAAA